MKELQIKKINKPNLIGLIKKMLSIDDSVYITVRPDSVISRMYVPSKDVVKVVSYKLSDIFEFDEAIDGEMTMSFMFGSKVLSILNIFGQNSLEGTIEYEEYDGNYYVDKLIFKDAKQKIKVHCQDPELGFISMSDDQIKKAFNMNDLLYKFDLSLEELTSLMSLNGLQKTKTFELYTDKDGVHAKDDDFDRVLDDSVVEENDSVLLIKEFFDKVDKESYTVSVCSSRVILKSIETNTLIGLNVAQKA